MQNIIPNIANNFFEDFMPIIPNNIPAICMGIVINGRCQSHNQASPRIKDAMAFPLGPAEDIETSGLKFFNISSACFSLSFETYINQGLTGGAPPKPPKNAPWGPGLALIRVLMLFSSRNDLTSSAVTLSGAVYT